MRDVARLAVRDCAKLLRMAAYAFLRTGGIVLRRRSVGPFGTRRVRSGSGEQQMRSSARSRGSVLRTFGTAATAAIVLTGCLRTWVGAAAMAKNSKHQKVRDR
ncbi:hypothetical protein Lesp02_71330 [Lentzea sp. NBRC 105346]|nr:hypothetical protein Lesp02_71330 [Lentzea sp. NBRC 105346]